MLACCWLSPCACTASAPRCTGRAAGGFACRGVTRDPSKDKAKALAATGAQVVKGDLDDVESLKKAFAGAYGVYAVTNFWEHFSGEKEKTQAKNIADAAKAAGVKHAIWSTLGPRLEVLGYTRD